MASNENDVLDELEETVSGASGVVDESVATAAQITSAAQDLLNAESAFAVAKGEGIYKANEAFERAMTKEIADQIDEEKLDETTENLSKRL